MYRYIAALLLFTVTITTLYAHREYEPVIEPADCEFYTFLDNIECGYLTVPEDRTDPNSPDIRIHYAILRATLSNAKPDPLVFLDGGPGGYTLEYASYLYGFEAVTRDRDLILFDQRGVGYSEPALECPEMRETRQQFLNAGLLPREVDKRVNEAAGLCFQRLTDEGIDLSAYNSVQNAADLEDLRRTLGYKQWNLYGISYGTQLALTAMREFPGGIRSVVLDSVVPPQVNWVAEMPRNADRVFRELFANCQEDETCAEEYPNLENVFFELVARLEKEPAFIDVEYPETGEVYNVAVTGSDIVNLAFSLMYTQYGIEYLPSMIYDVSEGNFQTLAEQQVYQILDGTDTVSTGMYNSIICADEVSFNTLEQLETADGAYPYQFGAFDTEGYFNRCQNWAVAPSEPVENEPVYSDIPALILSGQYDPITPPSYGLIAAKSLPNSFHFLYPGVGHGVQGASACAATMMADFLNAPDEKPEDDCIANMGSPNFWRR